MFHYFIIFLVYSPFILGLTIPGFIHEKYETFKDEDWKVSSNSVPAKFAKIETPLTFQKNIVHAHNQLRQLHGAPPLHLNDKLSTSAQWWAIYLGKKSQHRQWPMIFKSHFKNIGENIWAAVGIKLDPEVNVNDPDNSQLYKYLNASEIVLSWYNEISDFHFHFQETSSRSGHFSQVVWKNTSQVGVAGHRNSEGHVYIVCHYEPEGNIPSLFSLNVIQPMWFQRKLLPGAVTSVE